MVVGTIDPTHAATALAQMRLFNFNLPSVDHDPRTDAEEQ